MTTKHHPFLDHVGFLVTFSSISNMLTHNHVLFKQPCVKKSKIVTHFLINGGFLKVVVMVTCR